MEGTFGDEVGKTRVSTVVDVFLKDSTGFFGVDGDFFVEGFFLFFGFGFFVKIWLGFGICS